MTGARIASVAELPEEGTFLFRVAPTDADVDVEREAILVRTDGEVGAGPGEEGVASGDGARRTDGESGDPDDAEWEDTVDDDGIEPDDRGRGDRTSAGGGGVAAWLNYCQHFTHIKLDKGGGAPVRNGELLCTNHGAMFEVDTGLCTHGPCEGAYLNPLDVRVEDGEVYLDDPAYAFVGLGPEEGEVGDLSSTSNVEF